jgi:tRNA(Ile)-lysidine synthase
MAATRSGTPSGAQAGEEPERALEVVRASGLVAEAEPLLVMLSGGADSVCLLDVAVRLGAVASALHVNYGLRSDAGDDEQLCRELCAALGVELTVERAEAPPEGNIQAWARDLRYAAAERLGAGDYAAAHTASDQAETVLYRLATSPGRRALLGMAPRRGRLVRPLLRATAKDTRAYCDARVLAFASDPSNTDPRFARARVRGELLPALRSLGPAAELTIAETAGQLRDESEVLDRVVDDALDRIAAGGAVALASLDSEPPALRRLILRRLAERALGAPRALSTAEADRLLALGREGGSRALDLGDGLRAVVEYGVVRFTREPAGEPPPPVVLPIPGTTHFGDWTVEARLDAPGEVVVEAAKLGASATVRAWRDGDRMRPVGLDGVKTLQDLFTDAKVPRELRRLLPVVECGGEIVWVAGVALDERFRSPDDATGKVGLSARRSRA